VKEKREDRCGRRRRIDNSFLHSCECEWNEPLPKLFSCVLGFLKGILLFTHSEFQKY